MLASSDRALRQGRCGEQYRPGGSRRRRPGIWLCSRPRRYPSRLRRATIPGPLLPGSDFCGLRVSAFAGRPKSI